MSDKDKQIIDEESEEEISPTYVPQYTPATPDRNIPIVDPQPVELSSQRTLWRIGCILLLIIPICLGAYGAYEAEGYLWNAPEDRQLLEYAFLVLCVILPLCILFFAYLSSWLTILPPKTAYLIINFLGKAKSKGPGFFLVYKPFEKILKEVRLYQIILEIDTVETSDKDDWAIITNGKLAYRITNPVQAAYNVSDLEFNLRIIAESVLYGVTSSHTYEYLRSHKKEVSRELLTNITDVLNEGESYGVEVDSFSLIDAKLSSTSAEQDYQRTAALKRQAAGFATLAEMIDEKYPDLNQSEKASLLAKLALASGSGDTDLLVGI